MTPDTEQRTLRVSLEVFDGPLDLLLSLVKEQQLDIATVPLASVAKQYFAYVAVMQAIDVEIASEYLVIAATLVFLKSRSLLPAIPSALIPEGEETSEEVEERLRRRLITYSRYREVATLLRDRQSEAGAYWYREGGDPLGDFTQRFAIAPGRLGAALLAAYRAAKPERRTIIRERVSLGRQMELVARAVRERGSVEFIELCRDLPRDAVIVTFLAILELIRQQRLGFEQSAPSETLRLLPLDPVPIHAN